jgi:dynein heavy chain
MHRSSLNSSHYLLLQGDQKESVAEFMAFVHTTVNHMSHEYLLSERRYNYTTPKSFLEQVRAVQFLLYCLGSE